MTTEFPKFRTEDEERKFWASNSPLDFFDTSKARQASFPNLKPSLNHTHITSEAPIVTVRNISREFKDFWGRTTVLAVNDISFDVTPGEVFGLLGPNGSGKSTTLKMVLGLLRPTRGELKIFGLAPGQRRACARLGYLPEENHVYPHLNPLETLDFYARLFNLDRAVRRRRIRQLLEMTGLYHARHRPVGEFSKGMARRIGLAQALINDPDLVVLDEPTSGLDPTGCRQIKDLITTLSRRGKTVILSSHLLADVEDVCRQVLIMYNGQVIIQGVLRDLLEDPDSCRLTFPAAEPDEYKEISAAVKRVTGREPVFEKPCRTLEQFFLQKLEEAHSISAATTPGKDTAPAPTGATHTAELAGYLREGATSDAGERLSQLAKPLAPPTAQEEDEQTAKKATVVNMPDQEEINRKLQHLTGELDRSVTT